jgi:hypothetical protein
MLFTNARDTVKKLKVADTNDTQESKGFYDLTIVNYVSSLSCVSFVSATFNFFKR